MTRTLHVAAPSHAVTLLVAAAFAATGACALGATSASATPGDPHKVWVCKYVQKPGEAEVLKGGKNPIHVDEAALTNDPGVEPQLGDAFSDGQFRSVVVSLEAEAPATECPADPTEIEEQSGPLTPATPTVPVPTATSTATEAGTPTTVPVTIPPTTPATTGTPLPTGTVAGVGGVEPEPTIALAAVPALGDAAPDTGGLGQVSEESGYTDVLVGAGLIAVAGGVLAAETLRRRRRAAAEVD